MPVPELEWCGRCAGEHLKSITKEFQPFQTVNQLCWGPNLNASMQINTAWGVNGELETCAHQHGWGMIGPQMWWDGYYGWNVRMEGHWLLGMDRQEMKPPCCSVRQWPAKENGAPPGQGWEPDTGCPSQGDWEDEASIDGAASGSQDLVLMGVFKHPNTCWGDSTAGHRQSKRILGPIDDIFLLPEQQWEEVLCWTMFSAPGRGSRAVGLQWPWSSGDWDP